MIWQCTTGKYADGCCGGFGIRNVMPISLNKFVDVEGPTFEEGYTVENLG